MARLLRGGRDDGGADFWSKAVKLIPAFQEDKKRLMKYYKVEFAPSVCAPADNQSIMFPFPLHFERYMRFQNSGR